MKSQFQCSECGHTSAKWLGQCPGCQSWNTLVEVQIQPKNSKNYAGAGLSKPVKIKDIKAHNIQRFQTVHEEFNRVTGGGLVSASVVLLGGDPGIGKSTLLLEIFSDYAKSNPALYITGEESLEQVALRARTCGFACDDAKIMSATNIDHIIKTLEELKPSCVVIDSIQTLHSDQLTAASGSVSQVRHVTGQLVAYAKQNNCTVLIVGHMTKEGQIAGPKVLEHMVDTVLYFEGDSQNRYRIIRAVKNRFGPAHEIGVFAMTDKGIQSVTNPSKIFLHTQEGKTGSVTGVVWNGSRPILVEIQALVTASYSDYPKRISVGFDQNRLNLLIAILQKHAGINFSKSDVYINVVGGLKISETAADLAVVAAIISSKRDLVIDSGNVFFGEVGLTGEVRPVLNGEIRIKEISKQGMKKVYTSRKNKGKGKNSISISGIEFIGQINAILSKSTESA